MNTSVVILTKNEEKNIRACIKTLEGYDEIVVIDDNSTDNTVSIAKEEGAIVYSHTMDGDFAAQRNFGLEKARGSWVLFVDADERVSPALNYEIHSQMNESMGNVSGFYLKRNDILWERTIKYGDSGGSKFLRLAKKSAGMWTGKVHEKWSIRGKVETLVHPLFHYPHQSVKEFLSEINFYTDLRAEELYEKKVKTSGIFVVLYPAGKFIQNYFVKFGFLDGIPGLILAILMSFHSFLVRGKLWLLLQKH